MDEVLLALGVILTQVRSARRAIEEIERNTSRYLGFEFAQALTDGPSFGAPPMFQGALKVHVININDLAPGNSFGDFLMGFFGGIGNFVGGLIGGMVGGTFAGIALPWMIASIERITRNLKAILDRIGTGPARSNETSAAPAAHPAASGETLLTTLEGIGTLVRQLTALFMVASGDGAANSAGQTAPEVLSPAGERWLAILGGVNHLLDRIANIVNGLIILIPMVIGSIALLISNLAGIRRAILETFQFVLRNLLVLRGVLLTTIFETVASAARLVAAIVGLLSTAIQGAIGAIFNMIATIIGAAFDAMAMLAQTLRSVIGSLLTWLVSGVFGALRALGDLPVFRTIDYVVRILPSILEPIYMIVATMKSGSASNGFSPELRNSLQAAATAGLPTASGPSGSPTSAADAITAIGAFPDLTSDLAAGSATIRGGIGAASAQFNAAVVQAFDSAAGGLNSLAGRFNRAIAGEADFSRDLLSRNLGPLTERADRLAGAISAPINATGPRTGFEDISAAYEHWLTNDGLARTLNLATEQFRTAAPGADAASRLGLERGQFDRPRASVEIDRVEIVIEPERVPAAANDDADVEPLEPPMTDEEVWRAWHRYSIELEDRAVRPPDFRAIA